MPTLTILPDKKSIVVPDNTELLDAIRMAGYKIDAPCGGKGTCGKCIVQIISGDVNIEGTGILPSDIVEDGIVLSCKTKLKNSPVTIVLPGHLKQQKHSQEGQFLDSLEVDTLIHSDFLPDEKDYASIVNNIYIKVPPPQLEDGLSDCDRLSSAIKKKISAENIDYPISVLQICADTLRLDNGKITVVYSAASYSGINIITLEPGNTTTSNYGISIDIGTTTISVQLVNVLSGEILAVETDYNEQISCGLDVISRITYASRKKRLKELSSLVISTINKLIRKLTSKKSISPDIIYSATISGNTTMIHFLLNMNPEYIRLEPYTPTVLSLSTLTAKDLDIKIHMEATIRISPNIGSYVGGDITAGLLCTNLVLDKNAVSMFIDIGTNGELVIGNNEFLMACACSAGPAFEGGGINCGMRAATGAIETVHIDDKGKSNSKTIGDTKPLGICGSGLISLLAQLFTTGMIDSAGKLISDKTSPHIETNGRRSSYILVNENESGTGKKILLSELDIDNLMRTKAAIYSAIALILKQLELHYTDIDTIFIAGGFGHSLHLEDAITIGLLPDLPIKKYKYIGNASLMGTYMTLISEKHRNLQMTTAKRITYIELNTDPAYMDQYMGALFIPHTDLNLFPTIKSLHGK